MRKWDSLHRDLWQSRLTRSRSREIIQRHPPSGLNLILMRRVATRHALTGGTLIALLQPRSPRWRADLCSLGSELPAPNESILGVHYLAEAFEAAGFKDARRRLVVRAGVSAH